MKKLNLILLLMFLFQIPIFCGDKENMDPKNDMDLYASKLVEQQESAIVIKGILTLQQLEEFKSEGVRIVDAFQRGSSAGDDQMMGRAGTDLDRHITQWQTYVQLLGAQQ